MLKNYIDENYLHGFVPEPELSEYLWQGETTWDSQKTTAEQMFMADMIDLDYQIRNLRPELALDETDGIEDVANRLRIVINVTANTATTNTVVLKGSPDDETYTTFQTIVINSTAATSYTELLTEQHQFYKTAHTGTVTYTSFLVEANYDLMYAYLWLYLILSDCSRQPEDVYYQKAQWFYKLYCKRLESFSPYLGIDNDDGETKQNRFGIAKVLH